MWRRSRSDAARAGSTSTRIWQSTCSLRPHFFFSYLQAEKEVAQGMVHQLMSQLSRARMEKMSVLKGADGMTLQVGTALYIERHTPIYPYIYMYIYI
jgi:hypothetical protein